MRILISGATGLVGRAASQALTEAGHIIVPLVRSGGSTRPDAISWDPAGGQLDGAALEGIDGVIHLAGESIAAGRWTPARKARIRDSRILGTTLLSETLATLSRRPAFLISASAIGYYGNRGDEELGEDARAGGGFLAEVCREWEGATRPAADAGIRVVNLRIGMVLSRDGGALDKMLPPFRLGLGGPLGDGAMWTSWIHLHDLVEAIRFCVDTPDLSGPVNALAPNPVRNRDFTRALGHALGRPAVLPAPAFALRLALGEMADELLLASTRALPVRLEEAGFRFTFPEIGPALENLLKKS